MEEEDNNSFIVEAIYSNPLLLLSYIKYESILRNIDSFLPYSVGFEIECKQQEDFDISLFKNIPNILDVNCDSSEQRFRIPNGLKGMICLYHITQVLKINSLLDDSGIHYHIDMTENYSLLNNENIQANEQWMLEELDKWDYQSDYNKRSVKFDCGHRWIRFQDNFKTAEFRIGEMSFDYKLIIKRMIHASSLIRRLIDNIGGNTTYYPSVIEDPAKLINFVQVKRSKGIDIDKLHDKLKQLKEQPIEQEEEDVSSIMRNRLI